MEWIIDSGGENMAVVDTVAEIIVDMGMGYWGVGGCSSRDHPITNSD